VAGLSQQGILSAVKLYLAIKREVDEDGQVMAAGINCLNESHFSDTTPCLAWNLLFEDQKIAWGCEADLVSMMTKVLIQYGLKVPFMMTNLYPFLMGMAALKHEHIPYFPTVEAEPENHILLAHCGYFGVVPQSFSTEWTVREKVLAIVNDQAHALDARLPEGDVTLIKLTPPFDSISVVEGQLVTYAQFENSDCRNGAVVRVPNGHHLLKQLASHHYIVTTGKNLPGLEQLAQVFDLDCQLIA
jgi:L-fucose isomerase-like protein